MTNVEDSFARANAELTKLRKQKPMSLAEARKRAVDMTKWDDVLVSAARQAAGSSAQARRENGNGAKPTGGVTITQEAWDHCFEVVKEYIDGLERDLRAEIAELKARPTMKYEGVWDPERVYTVGDFVTDDGSLWHCSDACVGVRPGNPGSSQAWRLAVKRGRDGKSGR